MEENIYLHEDWYRILPSLSRNQILLAMVMSMNTDDPMTLSSLKKIYSSNDDKFKRDFKKVHSYGIEDVYENYKLSEDELIKRLWNEN